ncbi:DUF4097 domain-containing protein [Microbacterium sp. 4R-513]|uniref:DUF4097 family beta strand repeat-containing protein n=1 Tax=Microbacterium sp. 4R-513 TaxID=2567934 RepID=UPI0013E181FA|nr:DUF4097 family beta strand repeat-containing protein [Microbacterium sp. 4R-513]QIG39288.1 DUF4097 domain-containing protein [Microbacterium sp. 4R-513]
MSTTLTPPPAGTDVPPPAGPPPAGPPPAGPPTRGSSRVVAIIVIAFGALVVLGAIVSAVVGTIAAASVHTTVRSVEASGVDDLDVDVAAGSLRVVYADVNEAELEVTGTWGADRWTLRRDDDTLVVATPDGWSNWFGSGWIFGGTGDAVLRLPQSLEGTDADFSLAAGELTADGEFGEMQLDLGAGRATIDGSATSLDAQISAGAGDLDLEGVDEATLSVSAGSLAVVLSGSQPSVVDLDVSSGSARLTVPEGEYEVTSDVSAGDLDNGLGSTPGADSTIRVQVSAGQAVLRAS